MRANVNITRKQRHTRTLENFKGVDLSSSPLRVSTQRATYMRNLWSENGANHKRPGWREIFRLGGKINGVFPFEEGGTDVLLVHAGGSLYRVALSSDGEWKKKMLGGNYADKPSQCFYRDGRAYIIGCGAYLVYGEFDGAYLMKDVSDIAYIPTTAISIDQEYATDTERATLDAVNLLTPRRKNTLVGTDIRTAFYLLDGAPAVDSDFSIVMEFYYRGYNGTLFFDGKVKKERASASEENGATAATGVVYHSDGTDASIDDLLAAAGLSTDGGPWARVAADGTVSFSFAFAGGVPGEANITVTFQTAKNDADKIRKCTLGALFGTDGASDRLFISGNPAEKGMDRWSEAGDFTYFPDGNAMYVGGNESAITGYTRLSDATLAVFKEEVAGYPTIYYRTGASKTITDADGDQVPAAYFPVTPGMAGEGLVAPRAMANLSGDPLILTPSGVFGVELSANVSSGERYARERSRAIREELRKKDLSAAIACTYRGRYYLSMEDGTCYVADARYKTTFEGSTDTNYEWWVWDNVPATCFAEYDGKLLFGTADGSVRVFEEGTFSDRIHLTINSGDIRHYAGGDAVYAEGAAKPEIGDKFFTQYGVYEITSVNSRDQCITMCIDESQLTPPKVGEIISSKYFLTQETYEVIEVDVQKGVLFLRASEERETTPAVNDLLHTQRGIYKIVGVEEQDGIVLSVGVKPVMPSECYLYGVLERSTPVVAEWASPVLDLGTNMQRKTLLSLGVVLEPGASGPVEIGVETRDSGSAFRARNEQGLDLGALDLGNLSFVGSFAASHTWRTNIRNFNFIRVRMRSAEEADMAVSGVTLEYKINQTNRGYY